MKLLLLLVVLGVAYLLWRVRRDDARAKARAAAQAPPPQGDPPAPGSPLAMVECPVCAVHLPRADAVADTQGRLFCCAQHRDAARR